MTLNLEALSLREIIEKPSELKAKQSANLRIIQDLLQKEAKLLRKTVEIQEQTQQLDQKFQSHVDYLMDRAQQLEFPRHDPRLFEGIQVYKQTLVSNTSVQGWQDVLDLPNMIETCLKNEYNEEAVQISQILAGIISNLSPSTLLDLLKTRWRTGMSLIFKKFVIDLGGSDELLRELGQHCLFAEWVDQELPIPFIIWEQKLVGFLPANASTFDQYVGLMQEYLDKLRETLVRLAKMGPPDWDTFIFRRIHGVSQVLTHGYPRLDAAHQLVVLSMLDQRLEGTPLDQRFGFVRKLNPQVYLTYRHPHLHTV